VSTNRWKFFLTISPLTSYLVCLSAKSQELLEITGALYTLIATTMAMAVSSLILGLRPEPEISFHEWVARFSLVHFVTHG
jgi:hypothetical protein